MTSAIGSLWNRYRSVPLIYRIALALLLGSLAGAAFGERMTVVEPLGNLFLGLLNMLIIPIVIFTLLTGIRKLSPAKLGQVGGKDDCWSIHRDDDTRWCDCAGGGEPVTARSWRRFHRWGGTVASTQIPSLEWIREIFAWD